MMQDRGVPARRERRYCTILNLFRKHSLVRFPTFGAMKSVDNGDLDHSGLVKLVEDLAKAELSVKS